MFNERDRIMDKRVQISSKEQRDGPSVFFLEKRKKRKIRPRVYPGVTKAGLLRFPSLA